jgi:hypothetical protein
MTFLRFGRIDSHGGSNPTTTTYFDDFIVDFTNATFPLGP